MIDSVYIINNAIVHHDIFFTKGVDSADLIKKVDDMYNNAWNRLMLFWAALAIIIPIVIGWYQRQQLKMSESLINSRILDIDNKIIELNTATIRGRGEVAHAQAEFERITLEKNLQACIDYTKAAKYFVEGKSFLNAKNTLNALTHCISKLIPSDKHELSHRLDIHTDFDWLYENTDGSLRELVAKVQNILYPETQ